jgi:threonine dehydratase
VDPALTPADVEDAAARIAGAVAVTPCAFSQTLSEITGAEVWVKFENLQFTASFKERGALNRLLRMDAAERARGAVAASAGNHAQAVAYHAGRLGIPATIVMPATTPNVKVARTEHFGAAVVLHGSGYEDAAARALAIAETEHRVLVHPFDDPAVIAGQGTVALEMLDAVPDLDVIVVPVGGGGLAAGMAVAATARRGDIEVVGVRAADRPTIADGIAVESLGANTAPIVERLVVTTSVSDSRIEEAIGLFLEVEKTVAEGAGAAALAALLEDPDRFRGRRAGVVLSGGNLDMSVLSTVIVRLLARTGRLLHLRVEVDDMPGALGGLTTLLGDAGANIVDLVHHRDLPARLRRAVVDLTLVTRGAEHADQIVGRLEAAGIVTGREPGDSRHN